MARLGDYIEQIRGVSYKQEDICSSTDNDAVAILRANNIQDDGLNFDDLVYIKESKISDKQYIQKGDIVVCASSGSKNLVGKAAIASENFPVAFGAFCKVVRPKKLIPSYIGYFFQSPKYRSTISELSGGANINNIRNEHIDELDIVIVSEKEQESIVNQLDDLSNLISLRKQQLSKLDELVKSRFIELFGEWNSNPEPLKSFLKDITYGFTNPMPDAKEGPWKVTAKDVVNGKVNYDTARKTTVQAFEELTAKSKPTVGDVLLTKDGTLGRCAVVEEDGICVNQSVAVLKCNEKILPKFLTILLQMPEYQREMLKSAGGGTIKHIYITKVVDMLIVVPTISQQMEFLSFVEQTDKSKLAIQQSLEKLETLKKALMQKYFG